MDLSSSLARLAGARPIRALVNAGFYTHAHWRLDQLARLDPVTTQERTLRALVHRACATRFGHDHGFPQIESVRDFQRAVPLRTYEDLWQAYLKDRYPVFDNLTWPGLIPFIALTSGTTTGATKYIPVSHEMVASNRKAAHTLIASYLTHRPESRLFHGRLFFLGGSTDLETPAPGVGQGDLSAIAAQTVGAWLQPYAFPPLEIALEPSWDRKLERMAALSLREPITLVSGVTSCLVTLFQRVLALSGKATVAEVWPTLEMVVHGGVKFDPYRAPIQTLLGSSKAVFQESYPCSEGFIAYGDPNGSLLRLLFDHGLFYEFVPVEELGSANPARHWLGNACVGINYAIIVSTCAGLWAHVIGDTIRFESLSPPLLTFTGRTKYTLSAFGEHLISEEVEAAVATASEATGAAVRDWHAGPVFHEPLGHHLFVFEFLTPPADLRAFRQVLDADLIRRNAHYQWFRAEGGGLPAPALIVAKPGGFDDWMRARGQLGGQHKVPRIDSTGQLTAQLLNFLRAGDRVRDELAER
jgi:hypothetical protein